MPLTPGTRLGPDEITAQIGEGGSISTPRLELVSATIACLEAELEGRASLARRLGVEVPDTWPPRLYDLDAITWCLRSLTDNPEFQTWGMRYFVLRDDARGVAIGAGGYKGPSSDSGVVEIGYSILSKYERRGFASEAVDGLVRRAFEATNVTRVIAETLPDLIPSIRVLERTGFDFAGPGGEPGVIRYKRDRPF